MILLRYSADNKEHGRRRYITATKDLDLWQGHETSMVHDSTNSNCKHWMWLITENCTQIGPKLTQILLTKEETQTKYLRMHNSRKNWTWSSFTCKRKTTSLQKEIKVHNNYSYKIINWSAKNKNKLNFRKRNIMQNFTTPKLNSRSKIS